MSDDIKEAAKARLRPLSLANYRAARWKAIDDARKANMSWAEIGEALHMDRAAVNKVWMKGA